MFIWQGSFPVHQVDMLVEPHEQVGNHCKDGVHDVIIFFCDTRALVDDCDNHDDDCYSYYCYVVIIIFISVMYLNSFKTSFIIR